DISSINKEILKQMTKSLRKYVKANFQTHTRAPYGEPRPVIAYETQPAAASEIPGGINLEQEILNRCKNKNKAREIIGDLKTHGYLEADGRPGRLAKYVSAINFWKIDDKKSEMELAQLFKEAASKPAVLIPSTNSTMASRPVGRGKPTTSASSAIHSAIINYMKSNDYFENNGRPKKSFVEYLSVHFLMDKFQINRDEAENSLRLLKKYEPVEEAKKSRGFWATLTGKASKQNNSERPVETRPAAASPQEPPKPVIKYEPRIVQREIEPEVGKKASYAETSPTPVAPGAKVSDQDVLGKLSKEHTPLYLDDRNYNKTLPNKEYLRVRPFKRLVVYDHQDRMMTQDFRKLQSAQDFAALVKDDLVKQKTDQAVSFNLDKITKNSTKPDSAYNYNGKNKTSVYAYLGQYDDPQVNIEVANTDEQMYYKLLSFDTQQNLFHKMDKLFKNNNEKEGLIYMALLFENIVNNNNDNSKELNNLIIQYVIQKHYQNNEEKFLESVYRQLATMTPYAITRRIIYTLHINYADYIYNQCPMADLNCSNPQFASVVKYINQTSAFWIKQLDDGKNYLASLPQYLFSDSKELATRIFNDAKDKKTSSMLFISTFYEGNYFVRTQDLNYHYSKFKDYSEIFKKILNKSNLSLKDKQNHFNIDDIPTFKEYMNYVAFNSEL
ncbi:MAG: hypothetical protein PHV30_08265, partial [Candidatus Margulisbacteria bacterium]|nr:hypothetical protein [Candidatus Margulisiibacteriota bacterium]